jgi:hypothetical protein
MKDLLDLCRIHMILDHEGQIPAEAGLRLSWFLFSLKVRLENLQGGILDE